MNLLLFLLSIPSVFAYREGQGWYDPVIYLKIVGIFTVILCIGIIVFKKNIQEKHKKTLFWLIAAPVLLVTFYLAGHTVHENIVSVTKGPVHWHADFQVWACGEKLDLIDPTGLRNKVGSPLFHEHDDDRIHVEGVVHDLRDVNLQSFFQVVGGDLTQDMLIFPINEEVLTFKNGDLCGNDPATLKVYANGKLLENHAEYLYAPETLVPEGDCIIVDFSPSNAQTTDKICDSWSSLGWTYENQDEKRNE